MNKLIKKLFAGVMAAAMAVTMLPATAFTVKADDVNYKYVVMNVPYSQFYAAEKTHFNLTSLEEQTSNDVDAVTTATTSKYQGTSGLAKGTYYDTTKDTGYILGVTYPVALTEKQYDSLKDKYLYTEADANKNNDYATEIKGSYYFKDYEGTPSDYLTLNSDGKSFTVAKATDKSEDGLAVTGYTTTAGYGDYQITLEGVKTAGTINNEKATIYGAILKDSEGNGYAMYALDCLWFGTKVKDVEIAWSVKNGQGLCKGHGAGDAFYQYNMNGKTLSEVILITNIGEYVINANTTKTLPMQLTKYYEGDLSTLSYSLNANEAVLNIAGINDELLNDGATVSVSYTDNRKNVYLAQNAQVKDDKVELSAKPQDGVEYTITISTKSFPDITRTVATPVTDAQKTQLSDLITKAKATKKYSTNTDLKEHVAEAEAMVKSTTAYSTDANTLISELQEKIKATFDKPLLVATATGTTLKITTNVTDFTSAKYSVIYQSGRASATLVSGDYTGADITLPSELVAGTTYTVTITSDNYQDATNTIGKAAVGISNTEFKYTGKAINVSADTLGTTKTATVKYYSDKTAKTEISAPSAVGTYYAVASVEADDTYAAATSNVTAITIVKASQSITKVTTSKTLKASALKKKAASFKLSAKANGKITYKKTSGNSKITVSKAGKVTVKKGLKKGTYKIKVKVTVASTASYNAATSTKTVTVKVK